MKKVFIYIGHSDWGKSKALKVLTENNSRKKIVPIHSHLVRVRKMSNDDDGAGLLKWVKTFPQQKYDRFIIAFCPNVPSQSEANTTPNNALNILVELQKTNELYFFVQEEKFGFQNHKITTQEINWLKTFGLTQILKGQNIDEVRAQQFLGFIKSKI